MQLPVLASAVDMMLADGKSLCYALGHIKSGLDRDNTISLHLGAYLGQAPVALRGTSTRQSPLSRGSQYVPLCSNGDWTVDSLVVASLTCECWNGQPMRHCGGSIGDRLAADSSSRLCDQQHQHDRSQGPIVSSREFVRGTSDGYREISPRSVRPTALGPEPSLGLDGSFDGSRFY